MPKKLLNSVNSSATGNYALLTLLRGYANSMGLNEIRFHYPLQGEREPELARKAIETIRQGFQVGYFWALVDERNYQGFLQHLQTIPGAGQETTMILKDILHGQIGFDIKFRLDGYSQSGKAALVEKIMAGKIDPRDEALDIMFGQRKKEMELFKIPVKQEKLEAEQRDAFARNLQFFSE